MSDVARPSKEQRLQRYAHEIMAGTTGDGIYCGRCPRELYREIVEEEATPEPPAAPKGRKCMADMYADPPRDCDAPYCGCNPAWSECMQMLQECGWKSPDELRASQPPFVHPYGQHPHQVCGCGAKVPTDVHLLHTCGDRLTPKGSSQPPSPEWQPIETAPKDEEAMFWIRPLTKDETWCNTSGEPIVIDSPPELFVGKRGCWSSLWTATHWTPLPEGPRITKGEAP